jgi:hydrogenase nickel incorporation protein HypA/HybF
MTPPPFNHTQCLRSLQDFYQWPLRRLPLPFFDIYGKLGGKYGAKMKTGARAPGILALAAGPLSLYYRRGMHEYSIVSSIVELVHAELAARNIAPQRVITVSIVAGRLHQIIEENMSFAYEVITKDTGLAGSKLEIEYAEVKAKCRACGMESAVRSPYFFCAHCKSPEIEVLSGKELYLENLEIRED